MTGLLDKPLPSRTARPPAARSSLAVRVTLLVIAVAVLVAVIAGVVGVLVVRRTLIDVTTQALSDRADLILAQLADAPASADQTLSTTAGVLAAQGIDVVRIGPNGRLTGPDRPPVRAARQAGAEQAVDGRAISGSVVVGGQRQLVEARSTGAGGFALVAPADVAAATRQALERRLLWAILGGVVAAVLVGLLVARVVSRPLRRTAGLARAMGRGARDLRAPVTGPREVAEVAVAVNELADALQHSESRQRDFLTSVSHELRTPLAGITGQAQALADEMVPPAEQAEVGRSIRSEAARLERLVSDLLDLARLGADSFRLDLAPVDLGALVGEMAPIWQTRCAARGAALIVQVPGSVSWSTPTPGGSVRCWTAWPRMLFGCWPPVNHSCCRSESRAGRPSFRFVTVVLAWPQRITRWRSSRAFCMSDTDPTGPAGQGWGWHWRTAWCVGSVGRSWRHRPPRAALR